jgi:hypothetical protein
MLPNHHKSPVRSAGANREPETEIFQLMAVTHTRAFGSVITDVYYLYYKLSNEGVIQYHALMPLGNDRLENCPCSMHNVN